MNGQIQQENNIHTPEYTNKQKFNAEIKETTKNKIQPRAQTLTKNRQKGGGTWGSTGGGGGGGGGGRVGGRGGRGGGVAGRKGKRRFPKILGLKSAQERVADHGEGGQLHKQERCGKTAKTTKTDRRVNGKNRSWHWKQKQAYLKGKANPG